MVYRHNHWEICVCEFKMSEKCVKCHNQPDNIFKSYQELKIHYDREKHQYATSSQVETVNVFDWND